MKNYAETEEDINNVEAWAEVVKDIMYIVPEKLRVPILTLAIETEEAERPVRNFDKPIHFVSSDRLRYRHSIMRLRSLVVQVFTRHIVNNHSPEEAAEILFARHRYGHGSGDLSDYLRNILPGLRQARKE
jgi:hypothetical protein